MVSSNHSSHLRDGQADPALANIVDLIEKLLMYNVYDKQDKRKYGVAGRA